MIKKMKRQFLFLALISFFLISPAWGQGTGYIYKRAYSIWPSMPKSPATVEMYLSCCDIFTGKLLDCAITHTVIGLKEPKEDIENNGGHTHNYDTRPFIDPRNGAIQFSGVDRDTSPLGVSGQTQNTIIMVSHQMPQVAGKIVVETIVTSPPTWECAYGCFTRNSAKAEWTLDVGMYEYVWYLGFYILPFSELPDPSPEDHYEKLRGHTDTHPVGHYGTTNTIENLKKIAEAYYKLSGRILSVNDMSLPKGGLFDWQATWEPPHITHRTGTDVDINGGVIYCKDNTELKLAVKEVAGEETYPILRCEDTATEEGKNYHIDFD